MRPVRRVIWLCAVCLIVTVSSSACKASTSAEVRRLLETGNHADLKAALSKAIAAPLREREAVAQVLHTWAANTLEAAIISLAPSAEGEQYDAFWASEAYAVAFSLDPQAVQAYLTLGETLAYWHWIDVGVNLDFRFPDDPDPVLEYGARGLSAWETAAAAYPELRAVTDFNRAGALLALAAQQYAKAAALDPANPQVLVCAAIQSLDAGDRSAAATYAECARKLAPGRPDTLAVLAELGTLSPVQSETVCDLPLPDGFDAFGIQVRGQSILLVGQDRRYTSVFYLISTTDRRIINYVTGASMAALSPTGKYVAFFSAESPEPEESSELRVLDVTGGEVRFLTDIGYLTSCPAWSPDENLLAISSHDEGLMIISLSGDERSVLAPVEIGQFSETSVPSFAQWLPNGASLASQIWIDDIRGLGAVRVYDLATGARRDVAVGIPGRSLGRVLWSPDGQQLACHLGLPHGHYESSRESCRTVAIQSPDVATADGVLVAEGYIWIHAPTWSPDGRSLLLQMSPRQVRNVGRTHHRPSLWVYTLGTGGFSLLATELSEPIWDGVQLVSPCAWRDDGVIYYITDAVQDGQRLLGVQLSPTR